MLGSACSAYGVTTSNVPAVTPFGEATAQQAEVCVLRGGAPSPFYTIVVYDNDKLVGATQDGTYFCYLAEPGRHRIVSDAMFGVRTAMLAAEPGRAYYLKQSWLLPGVRGHALSWVDPSVALADIRDEQYALLTEVPANQRLPDAPPFAPALH
jgi:hypothetical protein